MACFICETCGTQFAESASPPSICPICVDERQYIGWSGQRWTTLEKLQASHKIRWEMDSGLQGIGITPTFGIDQRALLIPSDMGNILWECVSVVTSEALDHLRKLGGVKAIIISHPHFYSSMVEWSDALGQVPIILHEADRQWVQRPSPAIRYWTGDLHVLSSSISLVRCGGHFPGSTALHWNHGRGTLFPGDALQVVADRRHVTFMYSYPNYIPMAPASIRSMRQRLEPFPFDDVFGFTWERNIRGGAKAAVADSFDRYLKAVAA
jgi:glyoxylase-like metal-dependent hydrolase (beta-lactamase superfamily II)